MIKKLIKFFKRTSFYKFWLYTWPKRQYTKWFRKLPINEKAILLEAQHGTEINGNLFYLAKELATIDSVTSTTTHFVMRRYKEMDVELVSGEEDDRGQLWI